MMKKSFALFLFAAFLILAGCGQVVSDNVETTSASAETTQTSEPAERDDVLSANESNGKTRITDDVPVADESVRYRTADSERLEPVAVRDAEDQLRRSCADPDSLQITDASVFDCADDGDSVYYRIHFVASRVVYSGERLESGYFYDVGVRKADETAFDASETIDDVIDAYSIFRPAARSEPIPFDPADAEAFESAARQIASSRFKNASTGKVLSVKQRENESDRTASVWDVLCEGENDYGMTLQDVCTLYLRSRNGQIVEADFLDP